MLDQPVVLGHRVAGDWPASLGGPKVLHLFWRRSAVLFEVQESQDQVTELPCSGSTLRLRRERMKTLWKLCRIMINLSQGISFWSFQTKNQYNELLSPFLTACGRSCDVVYSNKNHQNSKEMDEQLLAGPRVHMNKNKSVLVQVMFEILRSIAWVPQAAESSGPTIILTNTLCHASYPKKRAHQSRKEQSA